MVKKYREFPKTIKDYAFITLGTVLCAAALKLFLMPYDISAGGFSGVAAIINTLSKNRIPVGTVILMLNIPFFIAAYKKLGRGFAFKTLYSLTLYSAAADIIPIKAIGSEPLISAVYGGAVMGLGLGIVIYFGACTGGTDLMAILINNRARTMSTGLMLFIIDGLVVFLSAAVFGVQKALFAAITVLITSKVIELVTNGASSGSVYIIFSKNSYQIKNRIYSELKRGVTELTAKGGYGGTEFCTILCAVDRRSEAAALKKIINEEDTSAFYMALSAKEIHGEGFSADRKGLF